MVLVLVEISQLLEYLELDLVVEEDFQQDLISLVDMVVKDV